MIRTDIDGKSVPVALSIYRNRAGSMKGSQNANIMKKQFMKEERVKKQDVNNLLANDGLFLAKQWVNKSMRAQTNRTNRFGKEFMNTERRLSI